MILCDLAIGSAMALSLCAAGDLIQPPFEADLADLRKIAYDTLPPKHSGPPLQARFEAVLAKGSGDLLVKCADDDVRDFFEASYIVAFYAHDRSSVDAMRRAVDELSRRGIASDAQRQSLVDMYVLARRIEDAQNFASHPANGRLVPLPTFAPDTQTLDRPTLWRLTPDGSTVERYSFVLSEGPSVIVVSSPWCHFSEDAARDIALDAGLTALITRHSTWIMPQTPIPDFATVAAWGQDYPGWPMQIMYDEADWPAFTAATPVFYFFNQGQIIETIVGWPGPEQRDVLRSAFAKAGMH